MYYLFKGLRPVQWLLHMAVVLLAVYWAITLIEGAQFWGSVGLGEQALPELLLTMGYGLLALGTHWLISYQRPRLSQLRANRQALLIYLWRSYLLPFIPILVLPIAYEMLRQGPIYLGKNLPWMLLMSLILLMLFSLVNQFALARYFLAVNARAVAIARYRLPKVEHSAEDAIGTDVQEMLTSDGIVPAGSASEMAGYRAFSLQERKVIAYDAQGQTVRLRFRTLKKVKDALEGDARFFVRGSWILRYDALDRQELIPETRAKKLYLKHTSNYFVLNKNDVGDFAAWLELTKPLRNMEDGAH
jgi:hypothetical protein